MNEIAAFFERARKKIRIAEILLHENSPEIAASRAYYAMVYTAETLLLSRGLAFSSHSAVIAAYGREFARPNVLDPKFHRYLIDAQETRLIGDYGVETHVPPNQVVAKLEQAKEFLKASEQYLLKT
jgi:uncharacterized protein (UPF0332 family)